MARSVGRLDFWRLIDELTPYELAVHHAAMSVEPWGDDRADMRAAFNTLAVVSASAEVKDPDELWQSLVAYLSINKPKEKSVGPQRAAAMMKGN